MVWKKQIFLITLQEKGLRCVLEVYLHLLAFSLHSVLFSKVGAAEVWCVLCYVPSRVWGYITCVCNLLSPD